MYIREGLQRAQRRRPVSFYLLLAIPFALLTGFTLLQSRENPMLFATAVGLLICFFGIVMLRAVSDMFDITREHLRGRREVRGIVEPEFARTLGDRVRRAHDE